MIHYHKMSWIHIKDIERIIKFSLIFSFNIQLSFQTNNSLMDFPLVSNKLPQIMQKIIFKFFIVFLIVYIIERLSIKKLIKNYMDYCIER